jgi:phosphatidylinositol alpha-1,6-mannosyltransferase
VLTEVGAGAALAPYDIAAFADYITDLVTTERWHVESTAAVAAAPRFTYARHIDGIRELLSQTARRRDLASDAAVKVLLLAPGVPPPMGGSERMAAELHRHLRQLCDVHLVSTSERVPTIADASIVRRPRSRVGGLLSPARFGGAVGRQLLAHDVDVVHALTWRAAVPLLCIPRSRRPPLVVHCLGAELLRAPGLEWLRHRVLTEADALLAISQHTAEVAHSLCARMPTVVPPGVDLDRFAAIARADAPSDSTALRVVSVGRLELRKRHGELIQAVKELSDSGVDCRLTIVGEGSEAANLAALIADLACGDRVEIVRGADEVRLLAELRRADVFALLARDAADDIEGFGIAYVEAAASGLPIVAGDAPGVLDAVQSGINAVITRSRRDVVEALRQLAANECARAEMSAAGVAFARRFAWPEVAGRLVAEYAALGAARRGSGLSDQRPDGRDQHA